MSQKWKKELITEDIYESMALWSLSPKKVGLEMFSVKDNKHFKKYYFTNKRQTSEDPLQGTKGVKLKFGRKKTDHLNSCFCFWFLCQV